MSGPWEDYKASSGPWEEYQDLPSQIPGNQPAAPEYKDDSSMLDKFRGVIEAGAQAATGLPATVIGGAAGLIGGKDHEDRNKIAGKVMEDLTYAPRTEKGKEYGENLGEFVNRNLNPLLGGVGHIHIPEGLKGKGDLPASKISEAFDAETKAKGVSSQGGPWQDYEFHKPTEQTPVQADVARMHDQSIVGRLTDLDAQLEQARIDGYIKQKRAQQAIEARQAEMEQDVARQSGLDYNAAERARQEQAPVLPDHEAGMQGGAAMGEMANRLTDPRDGQNAQLPPGENPFYVDPQGQAFRGNPAEPNAALGLERQGAAMDTELTHLRGIETPEGDPLRPLQDHEMNALKEDARARTLAETPISSKGKRGRQRGAVDIHAIRDAWESMKRGASNSRDYVKTFYGAFDARKLDNLLDDSRDPKSRSTVVLLSPDEFLTLARQRSEVTKMRGEDLRKDIREGLKSEKGLRDIPFLQTETRKGVAHVTGHEGRHRMDVFKEMGIEKVPVILRDRDVRWGETGMYAAERPKTLRPEDLESPGFDKPLPEVLHDVPERSAESNLREILGRATRTHLGALGAPVIPRVPLKQRGAVGDLSRQPSHTGVESTSIPIPPKKPVDIAANERQRLMARNFKKNLGLDEFDTLRDKNEALTLSAGAKDVGKDRGQKNLVSGINGETALSNNPLLKFGRTVFKDARSYADNFSRTFITSNDVGLSPVWTKMNSKERIAAMEALYEGDRRQTPVTEVVMNRAGFTDAQKQFVKTFYSANKELFKLGNEALAKVGLSPMDYREGHVPGVFTGAYKTLVYRKKANGRIEVVGVPSTDTMAQMNLAKKYIKEHYPDVEFMDKERSSLAGRQYNGSDLFSGASDIMQILSKEDPQFAEVKEILDGAVKQANNALFNFNVHQLHKKGVFGNEGNKPWMSPERNANDAFKAMVRYFEEGSMHHALQAPLKDVRDLLAADETKHMPNARKYLTEYTKKVTGDDVNPVGRALNALLDAPFRYVPAASFGEKGVGLGFGVGPSVPLKIAGTVKNNMSQLYMGWLNWMFTGSQFVQPLQTGTPFMMVAADRIGASHAEVPYSMARGGLQFMLAATEHISGGKIDALSPLMREGFQYAIDRGMFTFSEMEQANQGTHGTLTRYKDTVAEANMKLGEQATRTPMFLMFVDLLDRHGMEKNKAFEIAENMTQMSMIDYHKWERPMIYSKLGVMGGFAAGLTTFKHGYTTQQVYLAKQMTNPAVGKRQIAPLVASVGGMIALAGITGMPFYDELNSIYRGLTNQFGGEARTIREDFLQNMPEWVNSGAVSAATDLNIQGKFSSADMVPDGTFKSISPHLDGAWKIGKGAYDMATQRDAEGVRNFATSVAPSGWRGAVENTVAKDADGNLIGKDGLPAVHRTPDEWTARALTGQRPQHEAIERENVWDARVKQRKDLEERQKIHKEYERRIRNDNMDDASNARLQEDYQKRKGDVQELLSLWQKVALDKSKLEKERLEGVPSSTNGVNRYNYFNK